MLAASINVTCDGFCHHEDVVVDDEFSDVGAAMVEAADRLLLGRRTFEIFADYWPAAARDSNRPASEQRLAKAIVGTPRTVASASLTQSEWEGTSLAKKFDAGAARRLAEREAVLLLGSPSLASQLAAADAIDRYIFLVHPIVAGKGIRLFEDCPVDQRPDLSSAKTSVLQSGVAVMELVRKA